MAGELGALVVITKYVIPYPTISKGSFGILLNNEMEIGGQKCSTSVFTFNSKNYYENKGTFFYPHEYVIISNSHE